MEARIFVAKIAVQSANVSTLPSCQRRKVDSSTGSHKLHFRF